MKSLPSAISSLLGLIFLLSPLLLAGWDVWSKTIIHFLAIILAFLALSYLNPVKLFSKIPPIFPLFFAVIFTTSVFSQIKFNMEFELHNWLNYFIIFVLVFQFPDELLEKSKYFFQAAVCVIGIISFYQVFVQKMDMPDATLVNPNILAGYLLMAIPLISSKIRISLSTQNIILSLLLILSLFTLFFTKSSSAFVSILSAALIVKYGWKGAIAALVIFIFLLSSKLNQPDVVNRFLWWQSCIQIIHDNPLFGTGLGTFQYVYPQYKTAALSSMFAHNFYLQLASETGVPCLLVFIYLIVFIYKKMTNPFLKTGFLAILIQNIFEYNLFILANGILFWSIAAYAIKPTGVSVHSYLEPETKPILLRFALILLLIIYSNGVYKVYLSTNYYNQAEIYFKDKNLELAQNYLDKTIKTKPDFWQAYYKLSAVRIEQFKGTRFKSYLYEALTASEKTKSHNPYFKYYYAKKSH